MTRLRNSLALLLLLGTLAPLSGKALAPQLRPWPGSSAPCNGSLQACIDAATPGDTVEIRSDGPIAESIHFGKALTLRAGAGFHPDFAGSASIHATTSASGDQLIRIEGLTLEAGDIELTQGGAGAATLEVVNDTLAADGISVTSSGSGPVSFFISGNILGFAQSALFPGVNVFLTVGSTGVVSGNSLSSGSAIYIENGGPTMSADVIGNRVVAALSTSIRVIQGFTGGGTLTARVLDNLVTDAQNHAIGAECDKGGLQFTIANNTVADGADNGIDVDVCQCTDPGAVTGAIANNAITGNNVGYYDQPSCANVSDRNDLFFDNGTDIFSGNPPGPGSLFTSPSYFPDHSLSPDSPAIDAGDLGSVPASLGMDAYGNPRVRGRTVDIGAYEGAAPDVLTWPGPSCPGSLQQCVDTAVDGDVVEIATASPIAESISFSKPLTLRPAAGFAPHFSGARTIQGSYDRLGGGLIDIEGLTLESGSIQVFQLSSDPLLARIAGNTVLSSSNAIDVEPSGGSGAVAFEVSGNTLAVSPDMLGDGSGVRIGVLASATGIIANNSIAMEPGANAGGIFFFGSDSSGIDVVSNHIFGAGYGYGVAILPRADASVTTRIADNLVTGQSSQTDESTGAIVLQETGGPLVATVIDNTVADDDDGIRVLGDAGTISGLVANNIASRDAHSGIQIDSPLAATVLNRNNLVFQNGSDPFAHGPNTLTADPRFTGPGDYHLRSDSPAIDAGDGASAPVDLRTDVAGQPRVAGVRVDLGAYEAPEVATPLGSAAAALALAALARRRRADASISAPSPLHRG